MPPPGVAGQRQRGAHNGHAPCLARDSTHSVPVDRGAPPRRLVQDHGQVRDPHQPHEAVVRLARVRCQYHQLVVRRQPEGGGARHLQWPAVGPQRAGVEQLGLVVDAAQDGEADAGESEDGELDDGEAVAKG